MSIFKRIGNMLRPEPAKPESKPVNPFEETHVGDIVGVDLEEYVVSGKVIYSDRGFQPHRFAYYLQNGSDISCLLVEKGRTYDCYLCSFVEGALDDPNEVPTQLELDNGISYDLEHSRTDMTRVEGNTDFRSGDDVMLWRYIGPEGRHFFLQWQDGKFIAMEGNRVPNAEVTFLKGTR